LWEIANQKLTPRLALAATSAVARVEANEDRY
jgi:hypothetical protein